MRSVAIFVSGFAAHAAIVYMLLGFTGWSWYFFVCSALCLVGSRGIK